VLFALNLAERVVAPLVTAKTTFQILSKATLFSTELELLLWNLVTNVNKISKINNF